MNKKTFHLISLAVTGLIIAAGCTAIIQESRPATPPKIQAIEAPPDTPPTEANESTRTPQFDLQGHRGARGLRPENTLPAFEYALDLEVTTLELDLHLTKDSIVVITHDGEIGGNCHLKGQTAPPTPAPKISDLTLEEVKQYWCDLNLNPGRFPDQSPETMPLAQDNYAIPTLEELFIFVDTYAASPRKSQTQRRNAAQVRFNVETKRNPDQPELIGDNFDGQTPGIFEQRIVTLIEEQHLENRVTIQSFDHRSINVIPQLNPQINTVALTARPIRPADIATETSAEIWSPDYRRLAATQVGAAHNAGLLVIPWTVNDPSTMEKLIDWGVDGLITDYPNILADILQARGISY